MIGKMTLSEKVSSEDKKYHVLEICNRPWIGSCDPPAVITKCWCTNIRKRSGSFLWNQFWWKLVPVVLFWTVLHGTQKEDKDFPLVQKWTMTELTFPWNKVMISTIYISKENYSYIINIVKSGLGRSTNALCSYPLVKMEIRDSIQILTTAPIFLQCNYFRQKYLEIASCSDSLLIYIWVRVDHSLLQQ